MQLSQPLQQGLVIWDLLISQVMGFDPEATKVSLASAQAALFGLSAFVHRLKSGLGIRVGQTLINRLQSLFDTLLGDIEQWHKRVLDAIDGKIKKLHHQCGQRLEALNKVQKSATQLEREMADVREQNQRLDTRNDKLLQLYNASAPSTESGMSVDSERMYG